MQKIITITQGNPCLEAFRMKHPVTLALSKGEPVAIFGPNGSGKSLLADMLMNARPLLGTCPSYDFSPAPTNRVSDNIRLISFKDAYGEAYTSSYYQQRWNQGDEQSFPTVGELLKKTNGHSLPEALSSALGIESLLEKKTIMLSSGELRRFQLAKSLIDQPQVLILDNPFIGLDPETRKSLTEVLRQLSRRLTLILVASRLSELPDFIQQIVYVDDRTVHTPQSRASFMAAPHKHALPPINRQALPLPPAPFASANNRPVIELCQVSIRYDQRTILQPIDWTVYQGECWAIVGKNGSGKSTLLSLICADNPQAYACDIRLFGSQRGSGESIWDIKKRIGYVSPELFRCFRRNTTALNVVASGRYETQGLFCRPTDEDYRQCRQWMSEFGLLHLAERPYLQLSSGEQRLILLVRAFVKTPEMLILDEPFHGLDDQQTARAKKLVELYCQASHCTLLMVTHYDEELPACVDHKLWLPQGTIELLKKPHRA